MPNLDVCGGSETEKIPCPTCKGCGTVPLPSHLAITLDYLRVHGPLTAIDLYAALRVKESAQYGATAINRRLDALEEFGLVERVEKQGKTYLWKAKEL